MTTPARPSTVRVITTDQAPAWWFLGTRATIFPTDATGGCLLELLIPPGGSPPLHIHETLNETFFLLTGELVVRCGGLTTAVATGSYVSLPNGIPHTFRVVGTGPARMLLLHVDRSFLALIEAIGQPATHRGLPPPGPAPRTDHLVAANRAHGVHIVGPPLEQDEATAALSTHTRRPR